MLGFFPFTLFRVTHPGMSRRLRDRALPTTVEVQPAAGARSPLALAGLWVRPPRSSHGPLSVSAPLSPVSHLVPEPCLGIRPITWGLCRATNETVGFYTPSSHEHAVPRALRNALGRLPTPRLGSDHQDPPRSRVGTQWPGTTWWLCVGDRQGEGAPAARLRECVWREQMWRKCSHGLGHCGHSGRRRTQPWPSQ